MCHKSYDTSHRAVKTKTQERFVLFVIITTFTQRQRCGDHIGLTPDSFQSKPTNCRRRPGTRNKHTYTHTHKNARTHARQTSADHYNIATHKPFCVCARIVSHTTFGARCGHRLCHAARAATLRSSDTLPMRTSI